MGSHTTSAIRRDPDNRPRWGSRRVDVDGSNPGLACLTGFGTGPSNDSALGLGHDAEEAISRKNPVVPGDALAQLRESDQFPPYIGSDRILRTRDGRALGVRLSTPKWVACSRWTSAITLIPLGSVIACPGTLSERSRPPGWDGASFAHPTSSRAITEPTSRSRPARRLGRSGRGRTIYQSILPMMCVDAPVVLLRTMPLSHREKSKLT